MFRNYFVSAFRNLKKNKFTSLISIVGMSVGISCAFVLFLYIKFMFSFDNFHEKIDSIFVVMNEAIYIEGMISMTERNNSSYRNKLTRDNFPEIKNKATMVRQSLTMKHDDKQLDIHGAYFTDHSFLDLFDFKLIKGSKESVLEKPNSIVLTENTAKRIFGDEPPLGKSLNIELLYPTQAITNPNNTYTVSGIIENPPLNSTIRFNALLAASTLGQYFDTKDYMDHLTSYIYLELTNPQNYYSFSTRLSELSFEPADLVPYKGFGLTIRPFKNIQFLSTHAYRQNRTVTFILTTGVIVIVLLLIICINVINLQTARFSLRGKEIAVRKVSGAKKSELVIQLLSETILLCLAGMLLSLILTELALPHFNALLQVQLKPNYFSNLWLIPSLLLFSFFLGITSGFYGAFVLSSFKVTAALKSQTIRSGKILKALLIIVQLVFTSGFIIFLLYNNIEMHKRINQDFGFNEKNLGIVELPGIETSQHYLTAKTELLKIEGIESVAGGLSFHGRYGSTMTFSNAEKPIHISGMPVDPDFFRTMGIEIIRGGAPRQKEENYFVITESALKLFDNQDPFTIEMIIEPNNDPIYAISENIYTRSIFINSRESIFFKIIQDYPYSTLYIRFSNGSCTSALVAIRELWKNLFPGKKLQFQLMEEKIQEDLKYSNFTFMNIIASISTLIACCLTIMGFLGILSHEMANRTKEIGIRIINGAGLKDILLLFWKKYLAYVVYANIIAWPLAYLAMGQVYKVMDNRFKYNPSIETFLAAAVLSVGFTFLIILFHVMKITRTKPVKSLRYE